MRYYRVTIDVKAADSHDRASVEREMQKLILMYSKTLLPIKSQAELITPSQAGEKKNVNATKK